MREVFPNCTVTCLNNQPEFKRLDGEFETVLPCLPDFPLSVFHSELQSEQQADSSLEKLFGSAPPTGEGKNVVTLFRMIL